MAGISFKSFDDFRKMEGRPLPKGEWLTVTQEMINSFAAATHDDQWIHTDAERAAKESPFGTTIAHGFMSVALVAGMLGDIVRLESMQMGMNYGLNRVRFPSPVPVNSRLRLRCDVKQIEEADNNGLKVTWDCEVEMGNGDKPACDCEFLAIIFE